MAEFKVESQQFESGRWIQVLVYERNGQPWRVMVGTVAEECEAMSVSLENAIKAIAGRGEPSEPPA
jgi:hypothetical protein